MSKPKVAFFDFTSCEGCQLNKLNLENDLLALLELVDIVEFREAMDDKADYYDIAFIEGSISTPSCIERIHTIRRKAKVLVALGACAVQGGVNAMKNLHPAEWVKEEVYGDDKYLFPSMPVQPVSAVVKVDYEIRGCPMSTPEFLHVLKSLVLGRKPEAFDQAVCVECKLKENECVLDKGMFCLGPVTRSGCDAICPTFGQYCTGCRGVVSNVNESGAVEMLKRHGFSAKEAIKRIQMFNAIEIDN
ncbi:MAG: NADH:ubiquinone oxidoreductase [Calditrichaeota bacterium]|nr:MAG: NADH:ubiquinone oxidoreductase [Calditrichota bacterium]MBL1206865.1 NADH:ubiquinone oxidoreductase [Calditrichota bacterium]NOG46692.1 NADH:ubiquinone oxidoreductase [Calditrichota bacterium]